MFISARQSFVPALILPTWYWYAHPIHGRRRGNNFPLLTTAILTSSSYPVPPEAVTPACSSSVRRSVTPRLVTVAADPPSVGRAALWQSPKLGKDRHLARASRDRYLPAAARRVAPRFSSVFGVTKFRLTQRFVLSLQVRISDLLK